jgi:hypothetical protein
MHNGSRNLTLGVQISSNTKHKGKKLKMVWAFKPIKVKLGHCSKMIKEITVGPYDMP